MSIPSKVTPQTFPLKQSIKQVYDVSKVYKKLSDSSWKGKLYDRVAYETRGISFTPHMFPVQYPSTDSPPVQFDDGGVTYETMPTDSVVLIKTCTLKDFLSKFENPDSMKVRIFSGYRQFFNVFNGNVSGVQVSEFRDRCFIDVTDNLQRYQYMHVPDYFAYAGDPYPIEIFYGDRVTPQSRPLAVSLLIDRGKGYEQALTYPYIGTGYFRSYDVSNAVLTSKSLSTTDYIKVSDMPFFYNQYNPYEAFNELSNTNIFTALIYVEGETTNNWIVVPLCLFETLALPYKELGFACTNDITIARDPSFTSDGSYGQSKVSYIRSDNSNNSSATPGDSIKSPYQSSMITIYNPTLNVIQDIGNYLWTNDFIDNIKKLYNDPKEALISLHKIPYMPKHNASAVNVTVCGVVISNTPCAVVTDPIDEIECGSIDLNAYFGNFLDFSPYTKLRLYLPFCGEVTLNPEECINAKLSLKYSCNCLTGECLAQLRITRSKEDSPQGISLDNILYQKEGFMSFPYPLSSADYSRRTAALVQLGVGVGEVLAGGLTGAAPLAMRGLSDTLGAGADVATSKPSYSYKMSSGGLGFLGVRTPYLQVIRPNTAIPSTYGAQHGFMAQISGAVGDFVGYTEIADVHLDYVNCLGDEKEEIERLLKAGVIL